VACESLEKSEEYGVKEGVVVNMVDYFFKLALKGIITQLLGEDFLFHKVDYEVSDGKFETINAYDAIPMMFSECNLEGMRPINLIFPQIVQWNIGKTNQRNMRNINKIRGLI
jgi:hypothetical protein